MAKPPQAPPGDLELLLHRSWAQAGPGLRAAWPLERRLDADELLRFTASYRFCTLAYLADGERVHAIPVSFHVDRAGAFYIPAGRGAVRTSHLRSHPWAAVVVGPEPAREHRFVRAEGPGRILTATDLPEAVAEAVQQKLGDLSWCATWLRIAPSSLLGWGAAPKRDHSVGKSSRSPG